MKFMASHGEIAIPATSRYDGEATDRASVAVLVHRLHARLRSCFSGQFLAASEWRYRALDNHGEGHSKHIR